MEIGGVTGCEGNEVLILPQGIERAVMDGDAVIAFGNHPGPTLDGEAGRASFIRLNDDIAHEPYCVGIPKHMAVVFARHLDGLCRKPKGHQHPKYNKQQFFHGIKRLDDTIVFHANKTIQKIRYFFKPRGRIQIFFETYL